LHGPTHAGARRARPLADHAAIGLLSLTLLASCGGQPAPAPAAAAQPAPLAGAASPVGGSQLLALLPRPGTPDGWSRAKAPQAFGADDLWEFIDGAAETYLAFGFQEALSSGFSSGGVDVVLDIYRMADSLHAYGIFMQEIPPSPGIIDLGRGAYAGSNVVVFWKGSCYVKVTAPAADRPGQARLVALARAVADRLPDGDALPPEIGWLQMPGLAPMSIRFVPKDVLGQGYLVNAFQAQYTSGTGGATLVVIPFDTPAAATAALARYRAFVAANGRIRTALKRPGDEGFAGDAGFHGRLVAVRSGSRLLVVLGATDDAAATGLAAACITRAASTKRP
jgi:hypothetical protein